MPKESNVTIYKLIAAFVMIIVGVVLIAVISDQTVAYTAQTGATDTLTLGNGYGANGCYISTGTVNSSSPKCNVTITHVPTGWQATDCPINTVIVQNSSGGTAWTLNTDYFYYPASGIVSVQNTSATARLNNTGNSTLVSYTYCGTGYLNSGFGRTVGDLVPGFFALALLLGALGLFYSVAKDLGIF